MDLRWSLWGSTVVVVLLACWRGNQTTHQGVALECAANPADTSRPALPSFVAVPSDSSLAVPTWAGSRSLVYRNYVGVAFEDSTSGTTMRQFLRKYCARIVGGTTKGLFPTYIIEIVPLGPAYDDLKELIRRIRGERGVREASEWYYREDASVGMGTEPGNSSQLLRPNDPA